MVDRKLESMQNIQMNEVGLKCDNPNCDWKDTSIGFNNYVTWINKPCPKCGENVLTREDYLNAESVRVIVNLINTFSDDELEEMSKNLDVEDLKNNQFFSAAKGLENLSNEKYVTMSVDTHKGIKVSEIKKADEPT